MSNLAQVQGRIPNALVPAARNGAADDLTGWRETRQRVIRIIGRKAAWCRFSFRVRSDGSEFVAAPD